MPTIPQNYPSLFDVTKGYTNGPAQVITTSNNLNAIPFDPSTNVSVDLAMGLIKNLYQLEYQSNFYVTTQLNF